MEVEENMDRKASMEEKSAEAVEDDDVNASGKIPGRRKRGRKKAFSPR